jgi:diguanylate cyclase (GGDEF)-like protein
VIISVMLGSSLSTAFSMEKRQTTITLCILYGPSVVFFCFVPELRPNAIMLFVYVAYQLASLARLAREYDAQMATEYALLQSRAEIEQLTRIDALTGLANRREYEIGFPKAWNQATRQKLNLSMLVFDLDLFKAVNDGHGHLAGDACLQHFANLLRDHFRRKVDLIARIGGEEFVAVLPGLSSEDAARMAEQLREDLQTLPCKWQDLSIPMTVSIGVGSANPALDARPEETFARVDAACYEAKTSGRNRVLLSNPTTAKLKS